MTEAEWLACDEPQTLIEFVARRAHERKARLSAVALCRYTLALVSSERGRRAVDTVEAYADGLATEAELQYARRLAVDDYCEVRPEHLATESSLADKAASIALQGTTFAASEFDDYLVSCCICTEKAWVRRWMLQAQPDEVRPPYPVLMGWQTEFVRDIFGNPFRPLTFNPEWRTSAVLALAGQMYDARDFSAMPILADALQDAGCDNDDILAHCRGPGPHVRGCWVVDLVLGKE